MASSSPSHDHHHHHHHGHHNGGEPPLHYPLHGAPGNGPPPYHQLDDEADFLARLRAPPRPNETLGGRLFDITVGRLWRSSYTVLRLDLRSTISIQKPPSVPRQKQQQQQQYNQRWRSSQEGSTTIHPGAYLSSGGNEFLRQRSGSSGGGGETYVEDRDSSLSSSSSWASRGWLSGIHGGGARIKFMQVWDIPDKDTGEPRIPWNLSLGLGAQIEMERGGHPSLLMRLKAKHMALHLLPTPTLELWGRWPIGGTKLALNVHYRLPLLQMGPFWHLRDTQLMVNLYNPLGSGFHLTPGGLEFDEHVLNFGKYTKIRVAATVDFPRQFPLEKGEPPLKVQIHRLGLKTRIMK